MLHHGEKLNMSEPHVLHVVDQLGGQFAIGERHALVAIRTLPRAGMDFIDADGGIEVIMPGALLHPISVVPGIG